MGFDDLIKIIPVEYIFAYIIGVNIIRFFSNVYR